MRLSILVVLVTLLGTACGGEDAPPPTGTGETGTRATVTTTSGFAGPSDTTPPTLGPSFTVPLAAGFGVVCAGSTEPPHGSFALLEGPFSDGAEADAVATFYEQFLESEGVSIEQVDKGRNRARFEGRTTTGPERLVFVDTANTVHSRTVLIAVVADRAGFSLAADAMDADPACFGSFRLREVAAEDGHEGAGTAPGAPQQSGYPIEDSEVVLACTQAEEFMFAPALGNGAPDPLQAARTALSSPPVSINIDDLVFEATELGGLIALDGDGATVAWVSPVELRDGTWGAGRAVHC